MSHTKAPEFVGLPQADWVKPHITKKDTGGKDIERDNITDLNLTIISWIDNYNQGYIDYILLEMFREDFAEWVPDTFAMVYQPILRRLKMFLMFRGIYVGCENDKRATIAQQLAALLDDDVDDLPKWPKRELDQIIGYGVEFQSLVFNRGIRSAASATDNGDHDDIGFTNLKCKEVDKGKNIPLKGDRDENINYLADQGNGSDDSDNKSDSIWKKEPKGKKKKRGRKGADSDKDSGKTYIPDWAKGTITEGTSISRALMDLGKLYVNPQDKFGAKHYEVLENKLRIFFEKCRIAGVGENQF
ncbi:hypothetical protein K3495_g14519 [Podosphaera aphanis]|nr:hypothetical protein K3495_g14519 [Podosphaera aphanis]